MKLFAAFLLTLVLTSATGCRVPPPDSTAGKWIRCSGAAIEQNWHQALPAVNGCLTGIDDGWRDCLVGLINPAVGITEDVIACVTRDQGTKFADSALANGQDVRSLRAAERASAWLGERRYVFADGPAEDKR